jgi:hypothetical protein
MVHTIKSHVWPGSNPSNIVNPTSKEGLFMQVRLANKSTVHSFDRFTALPGKQMAGGRG